MGTFGYAGLGVADSLPLNYLVGSRFVMPQSGTIWKLTAYVRYTAGAGNAIAAIYGDYVGTPRVLLSQSDAVALPVNYTWVDFELNDVVLANSGIDYYLCLFSGVNNTGVHFTVGNTSQDFGDTHWTYPNFPDQPLVDGYEATKMSIYATYSPNKKIVKTGGSVPSITTAVVSQTHSRVRTIRHVSHLEPWLT